MKNSVKSRSKFSKLETLTNIYVILIVIEQFILSLIAAIINIFEEVLNKDHLKYLSNE